MAKRIKFDLIIDGNKVKTFEELKDNLHPDLLPYVKSGKLAKWFASRDMADKATASQAIDPDQSDVALLSAVCAVLELEADEDILQEILDAAQKLAAATPALTPTTEVEDDKETSPKEKTDWSLYYPENRETAKKIPLIQEHPWLLNGKITDVVLEKLFIVESAHKRAHERGIAGTILYSVYEKYDIKYEGISSLVDDIYSLLEMESYDRRQGLRIIIRELEKSPDILQIFLESPLIRLFTSYHVSAILTLGAQNVENYLYSNV